MRRLSRGNKQKIGLIQAMFHKPPLLILDEPTAFATAEIRAVSDLPGELIAES